MIIEHDDYRNKQLNKTNEKRQLLWISGTPRMDSVRDEILTRTFKIGPIMDKISVTQKMAWYNHVYKHDDNLSIGDWTVDEPFEQRKVRGRHELIRVDLCNVTMVNWGGFSVVSINEFLIP